MIAAAELPRPVMLYDGDCRLCRFAARVVAALDRDEALAFLPLADPKAAPLLETVPAVERNERWWLVSRGGPIPGDAGGGVALLRELRLTRPLGRLVARLGVSRAVDLLDLAATRNRGWLGRLVPNGPGPRRFP